MSKQLIIHERITNNQITHMTQAQYMQNYTVYDAEAPLTLILGVYAFVCVWLLGKLWSAAQVCTPGRARNS